MPSACSCQAALTPAGTSVFFMPLIDTTWWLRDRKPQCHTSALYISSMTVLHTQQCDSGPVSGRWHQDFFSVPVQICAIFWLLQLQGKPLKCRQQAEHRL